MEEDDLQKPFQYILHTVTNGTWHWIIKTLAALQWDFTTVQF